MAIVNSTEGIWINSDGLRVKMTARAEAGMGTAGEYREGAGSQHMSEFILDYTQFALASSGTSVYILDYDNVLPSTAVVDKIEFVTGTAWATDTSIDVGVVKRSDFTTIIDADGLIAAFVIASRNLAGETTTFTAGSTQAGVLVGAQAGLGFDAVVCVNYNGSAPTAGTAHLRIFWRDASSNA